MTARNESTYWASNPAWFRINKATDKFELTEEAPERAKQSFAMWNNSNESTTN